VSSTWIYEKNDFKFLGINMIHCWDIHEKVTKSITFVRCYWKLSKIIIQFHFGSKRNFYVLLVIRKKQNHDASLLTTKITFDSIALFSVWTGIDCITYVLVKKMMFFFDWRYFRCSKGVISFHKIDRTPKKKMRHDIVCMLVSIFLRMKKKIYGRSISLKEKD
jgi:hypothetical protein